MKNLIFKSLGVIIVSVITLSVLFTTGCEKEDVENQNPTLETTVSNQFDGNFIKEITVSNNSKSKDCYFTFEISSNNESVLNQISSDDIVLSVNSSENIVSKELSSDYVENESITKMPQERYILIKLKSINSSIQIENYSVEFTDKAHKIMEINKMKYIIDFSEPEKQVYPKGSYWAITCCKKLYLINNNVPNGSGYIPALNVKLYWGTSCSSGYNYCASVNISNYTTRSVCYYGSPSKYWRQVWVDGKLKYTAYTSPCN